MAFLCLLCRQAGHKTANCPEASKPRGTVVPGPNPAEFAGLHGVDIYNGAIESSPLCARCTELKIIDLMMREDVRDSFATMEDLTHNRALAERRNLGPFRSIELLDSCPLCRMIFGAFPAEDATVDPSSPYLLHPYSTCNMTGASLDLGQSDFLVEKKYTKADLDAIRQSYGVLVYIVPVEALPRTSVSRAFDPSFATMGQTLFGITGPRVVDSSVGALSTPPTFERNAKTPRVRSQLIDFGIINTWLKECDKNHGGCRSIWREELLKTRMLDVVDLKLVDCPPNCQYAALSYVWGGVIPEPSALENGTLPPTIMDAIEVTRKIGLKYMWVDALCIDQAPTAEKLEQLQMMDRIYEGAYITVIALHGDSSFYGLPGVTDPAVTYAQAAKHPDFVEGHIPLSAMGRAIQQYELVDGYPMAMVYPVAMDSFAMPDRVYTTRAWTLQEHTLSRRQLIFDRGQVHINCNDGGTRDETLDDTIDPGHMAKARMTAFRAERKTVVQLQHNLTPPHVAKGNLSNKQITVQVDFTSHYSRMMQVHSSLNMTDPSDALNTILGMISHTERGAKMQPFVWGLPLRDYPLFLTWSHDMKSPDVGSGKIKIRRRKGFPSWSYIGWHGPILFNTNDGPMSNDPEEIRVELLQRRMECGMCPKFVSIGHLSGASHEASNAQKDGHVLTLAGYRVRFEIKTEPFSEAFLPGTDVNIGRLLENNHIHPTTLPNGVFDFVVALRIKKYIEDDAGRRSLDNLYLIMLDFDEAYKNDGIPSRRTFVRWTVDSKFSRTPQYEEMLHYDESIQIV